MGPIAAHFQSYLDFATVDGSVNDGGTWVLIAGPFVIGLLGLYIAWNLAAAAIDGAKGIARVATRVFTRPVVAAAPVAALADTAPMAPVAPIARPVMVTARRAEALARSAA